MPSRLTEVLVSLLLATPAVIFWLWLVIVPARVAVLCPEECHCDPAGYQVSCRNTSLTTVPFIRLTDVRVIWLEHNNITLFEKDSFVSLTEVDALFVRECELRTIEMGAFNGLSKLTGLIMSGNKISEIIPGTFKNLSNLKFLDLGYNKIEHLDGDVFSGLVKLSYIILGGNELLYLHPDMFLGLPKLKQLVLPNNPFLQIPIDRPFLYSHSLSRLDISACNVSSVSVETFTNVTALTELDLSNNVMTTVDIDILVTLPELSSLYLYGNPLHCSCQLQEVWRYVEYSNIDTGYEADVPVCDTPSEVKGMGWGVLEKWQCLEGNIQYYGDYNNTKYSYTDIEKTYRETKTDTDMDTEKGRDTDNETETDMHEETGQDGFDENFLIKYQLPLYSVTFIFGTTGNIIILIIITCNKDMRTVPNMYILNLAISDIIYLTVLFFEACANRISDTLLDGDFMCMFFPFCRSLSVCLSAYSVAVLSIQRYRVTVNPIQARVSPPPTWRLIVATICGVWIVAALAVVPNVLSEYQCQTVFLNITYYRRVVIFELLVSCVLPLIVIAFTYIMTARHLVGSFSFIPAGTQNPQLKTRRNSAKIVLALSVVFLISFVPYHVFWTYTIWMEQTEFGLDMFAEFGNETGDNFLYMFLISTSFLFINSCLNPVAVFCTSSPFRKHLKSYLTCFCRTNSPPIDLELQRRH